MNNAERQLRALLVEAAPATSPVEFEAIAGKAARRRRLRVAVGVAAVAAVAIAILLPLAIFGGKPQGLGGADGHQVIHGGRLTSTINLDPLGGETFAPAPPYLHARLTAVQAYAVFDKSRGPIPAGDSYQLGLLTASQWTDVLAWGFSTQPTQCLSSQGPSLAVGPRPTSPTRPTRCTGWFFIDANTGQGLTELSQPIASTPAPLPTPTLGVAELHGGGPLDLSLDRTFPRGLVLQAPRGVIRWTIDLGTCTVRLHWFLPPAGTSTGTKPGCYSAHGFNVDLAHNLVSRGHVFTVIAGTTPGRWGYLVKVQLADGTRELYDPSESRVWAFAFQRCGDVAGTEPISVSLIHPHHHIVATRAVGVTDSSQLVSRECDAARK